MDTKINFIKKVCCSSIYKRFETDFQSICKKMSASEKKVNVSETVSSRGKQKSYCYQNWKELRNLWLQENFEDFFQITSVQMTQVSGSLHKHVHPEWLTALSDHKCRTFWYLALGNSNEDDQRQFIIVIHVTHIDHTPLSQFSCIFITN